MISRILSTSKPTTPNRRDVLMLAAAAVTAPTFVAPASLGYGRDAPSERLNIGVIGLGSRGFNLIDELLRQSTAQIAMICDVDSFHYRDNPWGKGRAFGREPAKTHIESKDPRTKGLRVTDDYREVCGSDGIDAVVIATPDHWHAACTLEAIRNGKDVYCEKPVTHTFAEGQQVYREIAKQKTIFQTGSQQRSDSEFRRAVELVRNGHLGTLQEIHVGLNPGYGEPQGDATVQSPPEHLDYEKWCGPAPMLPYMRARHHRWWRGHRAYGGGVLMDWIGHHNDIAHWAMNVDDSGPVEVKAVGWVMPQTNIYNTPHHYDIQCTYASGVKTSIGSHHRNGVMFRGDEGWLFVTRGKLEASEPAWIEDNFEPGEQRVYRSENHMGNFLNCIRSREDCISPAQTTHRSITPGHLGYISQAVGRALKWDPVNEVILDDEAASKMLMAKIDRKSWNR